MGGVLKVKLEIMTSYLSYFNIPLCVVIQTDSSLTDPHHMVPLTVKLNFELTNYHGLSF